MPNERDPLSPLSLFELLGIEAPPEKKPPPRITKTLPIDHSISGHFHVEPNAVMLDLRVGVRLAASLSISTQSPSEIHLAIDTACAGLAALLKKELLS